MKSKKIFIFIFLIVLILLGTLFYFFNKKSYNIVLISVDSLRADHMSLYGYKRRTTPNLELLSKKAFVAENYNSTSYLTPISEGSVQTGLYPEINGITNFKKHFSKNIRTAAEILKANSYDTAAFGTSPEFRIWKGISLSFSRGFDTFDFSKRRLDNDRKLNFPAIEKFITQDKNIFRKPFFLWLGLGSVHSPYGIKFKDEYSDPNYKGVLKYINFATNMQYYYDGIVYNPFLAKNKFSIFAGQELHRFEETVEFKKIKFPIKTKPEDLQYVNDMYDNGVLAADSQIAEVVNLLKKQDLLKDTIIVIQSQHGESLGEHKYIAHYDIWEESVHTPLIILGPMFQSEIRTQQLISGVDILPSILNILGIKTNDVFDGQSFFDNKNNPIHINDEVYFVRTPLWEHILSVIDEKNSQFDKFRSLDDVIGFKSYGIKTKKYKLIHNISRLVEARYSCWTYISGKEIHRQEYEFYDLENDAKELNPLSIQNNPNAKVLVDKLTLFENKIKIEARQVETEKNIEMYQ